MTDRDRCGWVPGTNPQDARIHRFGVLVVQALGERDPTEMTHDEIMLLAAAIWRRIDEEGTG